MRIIKVLLFVKGKDDKVFLHEIIVGLDAAKDYIIGVIHGIRRENGFVLVLENGQNLGKRNTTINEYFEEFNESENKIRNCSEFIVLSEVKSPRYLQSAFNRKLGGPKEELENVAISHPSTKEEKGLKKIEFRISNWELLRKISRLFNISFDRVGGIKMDNGDIIEWRSDFCLLSYLLRIGEISNFPNTRATLILKK
jgi:hypothetical protein